MARRLYWQGGCIGKEVALARRLQDVVVQRLERAALGGQGSTLAKGSNFPRRSPRASRLSG